MVLAAEPVVIRIVRAVQDAKRALSSTEVCSSERLAGVPSSTVLSELSHLSAPGGPLQRGHDEDKGGRKVYGLVPGFDVEGWASARTKRQRVTAAKAGGEDALAICLLIVRIVREVKEATVEDLYGWGCFPDKLTVARNLSQLVDETEPLLRLQDGSRGFRYQIRDGFDVDEWIIERGGDPAQPLPLRRSVVTASAATKAPAPQTRVSSPGDHVSQPGKKVVEPATVVPPKVEPPKAAEAAEPEPRRTAGEPLADGAAKEGEQATAEPRETANGREGRAVKPLPNAPAAAPRVLPIPNAPATPPKVVPLTEGEKLSPTGPACVHGAHAMCPRCAADELGKGHVFTVLPDGSAGLAIAPAVRELLGNAEHVLLSLGLMHADPNIRRAARQVELLRALRDSVEAHA